METQADQYALNLLRQRGISSVPLADLLEIFAAMSADRGTLGWLKTSKAYFASHPATAQRVEFFRDAGQKAKD